MRTSTNDIISDYMREDGGRFTSKSLAILFPQLPSGSISGALSRLAAEALQHGGAGIYPLQVTEKESPCRTAYQWRSGKPIESEIKKPQKLNRKTRKIPELSLNRTHVEGVWQDFDNNYYHVVPVDLVTKVTPREEGYLL